MNPFCQKHQYYELIFMLHNTQNNISSSSHKNIIIFHLKISFKSFFLAKFLKSIVFQSCHYPIQSIYFLSLPRSYLKVKDVQFIFKSDVYNSIYVYHRNYSSKPKKRFCIPGENCLSLHLM